MPINEINGEAGRDRCITSARANLPRPPVVGTPPPPLVGAPGAFNTGPPTCFPVYFANRMNYIPTNCFLLFLSSSRLQMIRVMGTFVEIKRS